MAPRSTERFLTTHTGSLPRPDDLIQMMYAKESGVPVDHEALGARVRSAVAEIVKKQADAGVDIINDGEQSKLHIPRGMNQLWNAGGIQYAPPIR